MPVYAAKKAWNDGLSSVPYLPEVLKIIPIFLVLYVIRRYFSGARNGSERNMHSKVVMVTGGTSGIGAEVVRELAERGAQIVLLTQHPLDDPFLGDYIGELRESTGNELINAVQVDLTSLHSIRSFATKWIDNAPPRRLDMIILCANTLTPRGGEIQVTEDDVEVNWGMNYLANFHLLSILSPAIRAQPPDRDVRIIFGSCASYLRGSLPTEVDSKKKSAAGAMATTPGKKMAPNGKKQKVDTFNPASAYATSKLALITFALAFQKHLSAYARPDKKPMNARVMLVDPGFTRTPGTRRYLTWGSLSGLALYLIMYPFWFMVLKSPENGAQTFLYAAMEARFGRGDGGLYLKECGEWRIKRDECKDEDVQAKLWKYSEEMVQEAEKRGAKRRAEAKKADEAKAAVPKPKDEKKPTSRRSKKA